MEQSPVESVCPQHRRPPELAWDNGRTTGAPSAGACQAGGCRRAPGSVCSFWGELTDPREQWQDLKEEMCCHRPTPSTEKIPTGSGGENGFRPTQDPTPTTGPPGRTASSRSGPHPARRGVSWPAGESCPSAPSPRRCGPAGLTPSQEAAHWNGLWEDGGRPVTAGLRETLSTAVVTRPYAP